MKINGKRGREWPIKNYIVLVTLLFLVEVIESERSASSQLILVGDIFTKNPVHRNWVWKTNNEIRPKNSAS